MAETGHHSNNTWHSLFVQDVSLTDKIHNSNLHPYSRGIFQGDDDLIRNDTLYVSFQRR